MTVAELIAELQKLPQDLPVVLRERGTSEAQELDHVKVEDDTYWLRFKASVTEPSILCGQGACVGL
jgi:hypothetical protein